MIVFAIVVFAGVAGLALVFAGRAISGARFNRALRAYVRPAEHVPFVSSVDSDTRTADNQRSA